MSGNETELERTKHAKVPGYFDFNTLTYGIAHSLPLAEYLAHIMLNGEQPYDMSKECDPLRYSAWATDAFTKAAVSVQKIVSRSFPV